MVNALHQIVHEHLIPAFKTMDELRHTVSEYSSKNDLLNTQLNNAKTKMTSLKADLKEEQGTY